MFWICYFSFIFLHNPPLALFIFFFSLTPEWMSHSSSSIASHQRDFVVFFLANNNFKWKFDDESFCMQKRKLKELLSFHHLSWDALLKLSVGFVRWAYDVGNFYDWIEAKVPSHSTHKQSQIVSLCIVLHRTWRANDYGKQW